MHFNMNSINYSQSHSSFEQKLIEIGLPHIPLIQVKPNEFQRFGKDKKYSIMYDGNFGFFMDWSEVLPRTMWFSSDSTKHSLNADELKILNENIRLEKEFRKKSLKEKYEKASIKATKIFNDLSSQGKSLYLDKKKLSGVDGIRFGRNRRGNFMVTALRDNFNKIWTLQYIYDEIPYGFETNKLLFPGGEKEGHHAIFGKLESNLVYICEGVATGLSILKARSDSMVVIAYDCNSIEKVTKNIITKYSKKNIIIAADNDSSREENIGIKKAEAVGRKFNLPVTYPRFKDSSTKLSDFNDLYLAKGIEEVVRQLDSILCCDPEPILFALNHPEEISDIENILGKNAFTRFAIEVSKSTETPIEFSVISLFCCFAACLQNKASVEITSDWEEPLVIQGTILGKSGDGKSPVFNHIIKPLLNWESNQMESHEKDLTAVLRSNEIIENKIKGLVKDSLSKSNNKKKLSDEELKEQIMALEETKEKEPPSPRIIVQDITPEQIIKKLDRQDGRIGIFDHEGGFFNTMAGRYSGGIPNLDVMLKGYSGSELMVDRADRSIRIPKAYVSTCIFMQPGIFRSTKNLPQLLDSGLLARSIYANPRSKVGERKFTNFEINKKAKEDYYDLITSFLNESRFSKMELSPEAKMVFRRFQLEIEGKRRPGEEYDSSNAIGAWVEKLKGNTVRIAGIINLIEDRQNLIISENIMLRAVNFAKVLVSHAISVFGYIGNDQDTTNAIKIWEYLKSKNISEFRSSDLYQSKRGDSAISKKEDFNKALDILINRNLVLKVEEDNLTAKNGRPELAKYRINQKTKNENNRY